MTVTVPHYVTTDGSGRWTGTGAPLSAAYFDEDIYTLQAAINAISLTPGVGVASISQPTAGTILFTMTDATTAGPFVLPAGAQWNFRGNWSALTAYAVDDIFEQNGTIYAVIWAHTSASTFSSGANDGLGHNYYIVRFNLPSDVLPSGGTTGQALVKASGTDYDCGWATLLKASNNLSDVASAATARTNLGLGALATLASVDLTSLVTGILPLANGGTGTATPGLVPGANIAVSGAWPNQTVASANAPLVVSALSATTGTVSLDLSTCDIATVTPTGNITINAASALAKTASLIVTTSGTTSYTITFGTNFKSSGTLATGTVSGKSFIVKFDGNGVNFYEFARSAAL